VSFRSCARVLAQTPVSFHSRARVLSLPRPCPLPPAPVSFRSRVRGLLSGTRVFSLPCSYSVVSPLSPLNIDMRSSSSTTDGRLPCAQGAPSVEQTTAALAPRGAVRLRSLMCSYSSARLFPLSTTTRIFHAVSCPRDSVPRLLPVSPVPVPYCSLADALSPLRPRPTSSSPMLRLFCVAFYRSLDYVLSPQSRVLPS